MCVPHRGHGFSPSCSHHLPDDWATVWGDDPVGGTVVGGACLQVPGPVAWRPPPAPWGGCAGSHIAGAQAEPCPTRAPSAHLSLPGEGVPLHRLSTVCVPDGSLRKAAPRRSDRASFFLNPCSVTLQGWWWLGGGCCWRSAPRRLPPCPPPGAPLVLPLTAQPGTVTLLADGFRWIPCVSAWLPAVPVH